MTAIGLRTPLTLSARSADTRAGAFHHLFIGDGGEHAIYCGLVDAAGNPRPADTSRMLSKLSRCMSHRIPVMQRNGGGEQKEADTDQKDVEWLSQDNRAIPAGYTYLAQLVAHDLVLNTTSLPLIARFAGHLQRDYRVERMVLDTIYGAGPDAGTPCFEPDGFSGARKSTFQLGYVKRREMPLASKLESFLSDQPARDIPRAYRHPEATRTADCPFVAGGSLARIIARSANEALIADARNDDHVIISQLTALFHELHNIVYQRVEKLAADEGPQGSQPLSPGQMQAQGDRNFLKARKVVAYVYRRIVVEDLLERLLDPEVYKYYTDAKFQPQSFLHREDSKSTAVPVEFSHAAFRFGHVMARFSYALNDELERELGVNPSLKDVMARSSSRRSDLVPLARTWLVDWTRFFEMGGSTERVNYSRRITPYVASGFLSDSLNFPNPKDFSTLPPAGQPNGGGQAVEPSDYDGGLFFRDLIRGYQAGVATVDSLIAKLRDEDRQRSPLLSEPSYRELVVGKWLERAKDLEQPPLHPEELTSLSTNPPLFFFILLEAAHEHRGTRLGILGSAIVAEVFFHALRHSQAVIEGDPAISPPVTEFKSGRTIETIGGKDLVGQIFGAAAPATMPELIKFIKDNGGLKDVIDPSPE